MHVHSACFALFVLLSGGQILLECVAEGRMCYDHLLVEFVWHVASCVSQ